MCYNQQIKNNTFDKVKCNCTLFASSNSSSQHSDIFLRRFEEPQSLCNQGKIVYCQNKTILKNKYSLRRRKTEKENANKTQTNVQRHSLLQRQDFKKSNLITRTESQLFTIINKAQNDTVKTCASSYFFQQYDRKDENNFGRNSNFKKSFFEELQDQTKEPNQKHSFLNIFEKSDHINKHSVLINKDQGQKMFSESEVQSSHNRRKSMDDIFQIPNFYSHQNMTGQSEKEQSSSMHLSSMIIKKKPTRSNLFGDLNFKDTQSVGEEQSQESFVITDSVESSESNRLSEIIVIKPKLKKLKNLFHSKFSKIQRASLQLD